MRNKIEKTHAKGKIITRTRQYLRNLAICLRPQSCKDFTIIMEKYKVQQYSFSHSKKRQPQTLITKNVFYILSTGFTMGYKTGQKIFPAWACWPKPSLHELNLKKSPIKKSHNIIRVGSGQVINQIKHNQAPQNPTNLPLGDQFNH